jgi:hypothetical protein
LLQRFSLIFCLSASCLVAAEADALAISANIQDRHNPFKIVMDPFLDEAGNVTGYTRCGDAAIWTGHYLAAESLRYRVTNNHDAFLNILTALQGIRGLIEVTGTDVLARCYLPKDSPHSEGMRQEESSHGIFEGRCLGRDCWWVGNTSRDQYIGVFLGLATAWENVGDEALRAEAAHLITRLLDRLQGDGWAIKMPNGDTSSVFWVRPDQKLNLLAIGARVNARSFSSDYSWERFLQAAFTSAPVATEVMDPYHSYFKFNLNVATFYTLVRWEGNRTYRTFYKNAYDVLRRTVDNHGNAHFNMIDHAINGPDERRDAETRALLEQWLTRPLRDEPTDWRGVFPHCGDEIQACDPIPVPQRVRTDFLWQRSPFQLVGPGVGNIESAGIDYILPYWMARFYGVIQGSL